MQNRLIFGINSVSELVPFGCHRELKGAMDMGIIMENVPLLTIGNQAFGVGILEALSGWLDKRTRRLIYNVLIGIGTVVL